jgi:hypothetical protein
MIRIPLGLVERLKALRFGRPGLDRRTIARHGFPVAGY